MSALQKEVVAEEAWSSGHLPYLQKPALGHPQAAKEGCVSKSIFMESTEVPAARSASEIVAELVQAGAGSINTDYENGRIKGVRWTMKVNGRDVWFDMPVRIEPVYQILYARSGDSSRFDETKAREKAERIAWRQLLRWVQAQNSMIMSEMAQAGEVYMAYACAPGTDRTMFQLWTAQLALPAPEVKNAI